MLLLAAVTIPCQAAEFDDVLEEAWYTETVETVSNAGWMTGTAPGEFSPDAPVTMEHTAAASFLLSALSILSSGLSSERILRLLKRDLCGFRPRQRAV